MIKVRLRRMGSNRRPAYRIVVSDARRTPQGAFLEDVGFYNPRTNPPELRLNRERLEFWLARGAQLSETVASLYKRARS